MVLQATHTRLSLHIKRPLTLQVPLVGAFSQAMHEVTAQTSSRHGAVYLGIHRAAHSDYWAFAPVDRSLGLNRQDSIEAAAAIGYIAGEVRPRHNVRADDHVVFVATTEQVEQVQRHIDTAQHTPPDFHATKKNCLRFALAALELVGITLVTALPTELVLPRQASEALQQQPIQPDRSIVIGKPLLLGVDPLPV
jgi:hypothetical protein